MNAERQAIYDKSGCRCWYCGCKLTGKWHKDHIDPVYRDTKYCPHRGQFVPSGEMLRPQNDTRENLVAACIPCNLFKATFTIEQFRQEIQMQVERARKSSVNFRTAERFGLIEVKPKEVKFWFELNAKREEAQ